MEKTYLNTGEHARGLQNVLLLLEAVVFDFDGVFTDNTVRVDQNGVESVSCWRSDGLGLKRLREIGISTLILSTEENLVVSVRAAKLKTECIQGVSDKSVALKQWTQSHHFALERIAYVGNDINDLTAFAMVGLPIAVADAYPEVLSHVLMSTARNGGFGAVREVCDMIYHARKANQ
jgi:YrbI family 3-deoxy-D-manno-octulosonate 8-phosphate phosphatase